MAYFGSMGPAPRANLTTVLELRRDPYLAARENWPRVWMRFPCTVVPRHRIGKLSGNPEADRYAQIRVNHDEAVVVHWLPEDLSKT